MTWPDFDLGEAINQTISAFVTVTGVFVGGWLAFSLGVRQLRRERAIDRRIDSQEKLLAATEEYRILLRLLISEYATLDSVDESQSRMRYLTFREATDKGREVGRLLSRADLYSTAEERAERGNLLVAQLQAYIVSSTLSADSSSTPERLKTLEDVTLVLEKQEHLLKHRLRHELALQTSD